jgi:hypothetical protein
VSRGWYHYGAKPVFDQTWAFELPGKRPDQLNIVIEFFHAVAKADSTDRQRLGYSILTLINRGQVLTNEAYELPIGYGAVIRPISGPAEPGSSVSLKLRMDTSFIITDRVFVDFFEAKGAAFDNLTRVPPATILPYFFRIVEIP